MNCCSCTTQSRRHSVPRLGKVDLPRWTVRRDKPGPGYQRLALCLHVHFRFTCSKKDKVLALLLFVRMVHYSAAARVSLRATVLPAQQYARLSHHLFHRLINMCAA
jgi:hypothetical protein